VKVCTETINFREWVIENCLEDMDDEEIADFEKRFPSSEGEVPT
jgi:hypothetical protein